MSLAGTGKETLQYKWAFLRGAIARFLMVILLRCSAGCQRGCLIPQEAGLASTVVLAFFIRPLPRGSRVPWERTSPDAAAAAGGAAGGGGEGGGGGGRGDGDGRGKDSVPKIRITRSRSLYDGMGGNRTLYVFVLGRK